jgi:hypothetical protein
VCQRNVGGYVGDGTLSDDGSPIGPQNLVHTPAPDVAAIGDILKEMLNNPTCGDFVNKLYSKVAANNPRNVANSATILELFGKITGQDKGGIVRRNPLIIEGKPANGTVSGLLETNDATVIIGGVVLHGGSPNPTAAEISRRISLYDATVTLHELFHLAGKNYWYSDEQLAKAVFDFTGAEGLPPEGSDSFKWSAYWNNQLLNEKNCPPPKK